MDINKIRNETPGAKYVCHFNNAGAALPAHDTVQAITNFINKEARTGGYRMQFSNEALLQGFYQNAAKLINASPEEIAFVHDATTAQNKILYSLPWKRGDVVVTTEQEYSNGYLSLLHLKKTRGIKIRVVPGIYTMEEFESYLDENVKLISVAHIPTSSGQISPVEEIGKLANKYSILFLLDSCQSVGQLPLDVQKIGCHFATATGRKYLRGPRGTGFLYVNKSTWDLLSPDRIEAWFANWESKTKYSFDKSAKMFEGFEKPYALLAGLSTAMDYQNQLGIENTWQRIQSLSSSLRKKLDGLKKVRVVDPPTPLSGIVTFVKKGITSESMGQQLLSQNINISGTARFSALLDLKRRKLQEACRASVHYYNTEEEIEKLIKAVDAAK